MLKYLKNKFFKSSFEKAYNQGYVDCMMMIYKDTIGLPIKDYKTYIGGQLYSFVAYNGEPPLGYSCAEILRDLKKYKGKSFI